MFKQVRLNLFLAVFVSSAVLLFMIFAVGWRVSADSSREPYFQIVENNIKERTAALESLFFRSLERDWNGLLALANLMSETQEVSGVKVGLTYLANTSQNIAFAGMVNIHGSLEITSDERMKSITFDNQAWFSDAMTGPQFSLLIKDPAVGLKLADANKDFFVMSAPIFGASGTPAGAIFAYIDVKKLAGTFMHEGTKAGLQAFLLDGSGRVIAAEPPHIGSTLELPSLRAAASGQSRAFVEVWPDGDSYLSTIRAGYRYGALPVLSWSIVSRVPISKIDAVLQQIREPIFRWSLLTLVFGMGVLYLVAHFISRDARRLAGIATSISQGKDVYPPDDLRIEEFRRIANGLGILQAELDTFKKQNQNTSEEGE